jgi:hypothetical protein
LDSRAVVRTWRVTLAFSQSRVSPLVSGKGGGAGAPDLGGLSSRAAGAAAGRTRRIKEQEGRMRGGGGGGVALDLCTS